MMQQKLSPDATASSANASSRDAVTKQEPEAYGAEKLAGAAGSESTVETNGRATGIEAAKAADKSGRSSAKRAQKKSVQDMTPEELQAACDWQPHTGHGLHEIIIRTTDLVKQYGDVTAVDHLNLEIHKGEVFGLLGPNGAGKTTTTLMLLGLTDPTSGTAEINGIDCTKNSLAVKRIVGYLPDNVGFYPDMTGRENLLFSGEMNGLSRETARARATALLERVGMTYAADRRTGTYSRGMRQRLGIADVLMKDPDIIIMDEPTLGIDPQGMHELTALIRELSVKDGRTILISSHELYQIQEISDRVGIFVKGKMIACGRIDELGKQLQNEGLYMVDFKAEQPASDANASTEAQQILVGEHLKSLVRSIPGVRLVGQKEDGTIHVESSEDIRRTLFQKLYEDGYVLSELHERGGDLDEIYRKYFEKAEEDEEAKKQEEAAAQETKSLSKKLLSGFRK